LAFFLRLSRRSHLLVFSSTHWNKAGQFSNDYFSGATCWSFWFRAGIKHGVSLMSIAQESPAGLFGHALE
jgi:hypothetical protein